MVRNWKHMARMKRDSTLETREGRKKLKQQTNPYWKPLHRNGHIGYRKGKNSRTWYARYKNEGTNTGYKTATIGKADDFEDANGMTVLSYREAQQQALEWFKEIELQRAGHLPSGKYTVKDAINDYGDWYMAHRKSWDKTALQIEAHILPVLGEIELSRLTTHMIRDWHQKIAETPPRRRTSKYSEHQNLGALNNEDARRKRKSTANRILTILKAALNKAYEEGKISSDDAWRRVKPFKSVENAKIRYLTQDEIKRIINATIPEFRPMVQAAIYTGCRYGELCSLTLADCNLETGTLRIASSKSGKPRHVILNDEAQAFFGQHTLPLQNSDDLVFSRRNGEVWGRSHQTRRLKEASEAARINPAVSFHILRHTHASQLAMAGVPMAVIAEQLGNSAAICEKHYAHVAPSYVADTIRSNFPKLEIDSPESVRSFHAK